MARLSREQQREYEEEMEYRRNQPVDIPDRPKPSAMDRIVNAAKGVGNKLQDINSSPTGQRVRSFAERVNAQNGLSGSNQSQPVPLSNRRRAQMAAYPQEPPINQGSSLHPGNRIYVMEGNIIASGGQKSPVQQLRRSNRRPLQGGLGQQDTGFDDDRGL